MKLRTWCIRSGQILAKPVLVFAGFLVFLTIFNPATIQAEDGRGTITIRHENVPIQKVFQSIEKQSGYRFFYNETLLQGAVKVTLHLQNVSLQEALDACFRNQPLSYAIVDKTIIVKRRPEQQSVAPIPAAVSFTTSKKGKLIAVRGKVTSNNVPVVGASIMIKGTDNGASTDKDGIFTLAEVDEEAVLVVSSVSHQAREVRLNGQTFISIDLSQKSDDLDEAVVVAYNTTTRRMNTGAVTVIKGADVQNLPNRSIDKSLQGLVPGLLVTSGTGQPGGGVSNFVLRGIATGGDGLQGSTVRNPLIVVDGIPVTQDHNQWATGVFDAPVINPMAQLNPADIESITVLKDAAAVALYGSKASNGVLLITTKKGIAGKTRISFQHQNDIASRLQGKNKLLNQEEYMDLLYETYKNTNSTIWTDAAILTDLKSKFPTKSDGSFYYEPDLEKQIYTENATAISNNLSFSGGNEKSSFYLNLEYTKQNGVAKKTGYDRESVRFNFDNKPLSWLKLGLNAGLSYNVQDYASLTVSSFPIAISTFNSPLNPIRLEDGTYNLNFAFPIKTANPIAANDYNLKRNTSYRGLSKVYAEVNFLKNFKFTTNLGIDFMLLEAKEKFDPRLYDDYTRTTGIGRIQERSSRNANLITTNTLRFGKIIGKKHNVNVLLGQEAQIKNNKFLEARGTNLQTTSSDQINSASTREVYGSVDRETLESFFGQLNYSYKSKYLLTASIRNDASSRFGERNRHGTYWSTGAGWVISEESFIKSNVLWLNYLKIRGSVGVAGNSSAIDKLTRYDQLTNATYLNDFAILPYRAGNPDIKWEQTFTWDMGLELRLFKQRVSFTADIYKRKTSDVVYTTNRPFTTGTASILDNIGDMENKGVELSASIDIVKNKNLRWNLNTNWSTNKNILVKANVPLASVTGDILGNEEGRSFNSYFLPVWAGVNSEDGSPQWYDGKGNVTKVYPSTIADRKFVGKPQPDGFGAITNTFDYKNFELSAQIYYQYGFQIYSSYLYTNDGIQPYLNQDKTALNRWQKRGDDAINPKRILNNPNAAVNSTRFLYDGSFWRLQTVSLGYTLNKRVTDLLHVNMVKFYAQAYNIAVWYKAYGADPSNVGVQGSMNTGVYPNQKTYSLGLNVNF